MLTDFLNERRKRKLLGGPGACSPGKWEIKEFFFVCGLFMSEYNLDYGLRTADNGLLQNINTLQTFSRQLDLPVKNEA